MKIINLSYDDYANFSYNNCMALRSVGIDCNSYKRIRHQFGYEDQCKIVSMDQILDLIKDADIVQLMHSDNTWLNICADLGKRVVVYHTGTAYRNNPDNMNTFFNPIVEKCFTDQCEFIGLGMKNETYTTVAIDTDKFKPLPWLVSGPFTIGHYPSNPEVKGTVSIVQMIKKLKQPNKFVYAIDRVNHVSQIRRMSQCDIYIEMFKPILNCRPYGCYGVTAFEAASMGKIVITNNIREDVYYNYYQVEPALFIANTENTFLSLVDDILNSSKDEIKKMQQYSREWVIEKHSYKAIGERIARELKIW